MGAWKLSLQDSLRMQAGTRDIDFIFFDKTCVYRGEGDIARQGEPHGGAIRLPDGKTLPPQVASFTTPDEDKRRFFMVIALPEIWRAANVQSELILDTLLVVVFVHEMTHTRQFRSMLPILDAIDTRWKVGSLEGSHVVQDRFRDTPEFVSEIDAERALLFRAAAAATDEEAREAARQALARITARRARFYVGEDEKFAELEDAFLTMEGIAQWVAYQWLLHPDGGGFKADFALPNLRRGGRYWSMDEGLAIFLVVDRLVSDWKVRTFAEQPATALELLAEATR
jgi:hypothetical protein